MRHNAVILVCLAAVCQSYVLENTSPRIYGGRNAKLGEYPYQVSIQAAYPGGRSVHTCGGSILNSYWILTAAHCVDKETINPKYEYFAKVGKLNIEIDEPTQQVSPFSKIFVHEGWVHGKLDGYHDIALVKLAKPLYSSPYVKPILLPRKGSIPSGIATLSGWGQTSKDSKLPAIMQTANVRIIDIPTCRKLNIKFAPGVPHDTNVCTGPPTTSATACPGDSGGPLVLTTNGRLEVIGIPALAGASCGETYYPTLYTRVSAYIDWIYDRIVKNS